jgi:molybdopterin molybdotransferase
VANDLLAVEEARARILAELTPTAAETVALAQGAGRVLARAVIARLTQPPADVSAMDGYAVRAADATEGATLRLTGAAPAGRPFVGRVGAGEAVRIFTGGFVPAGAEAAVKSMLPMLSVQVTAGEADRGFSAAPRQIALLPPALF